MAFISEKQHSRGRKPGSVNRSTVRKRIIQQLELAVLDETLSSEIRARAALRLIEKGSPNG
jgi:hypothetical protein